MKEEKGAGAASAPSASGIQNAPSVQNAPSSQNAPTSDRPDPATPNPKLPTQNSPQGSLLAGGISIKMPPPPVSAAPKVQVEAKPLTQDDLERYWHETADELNLTGLMAAATVRLGENTRIIDIEATETWFASDFRPHRIEVMESLRKKSGMPMLECNVIPLYVSSGTIIYTAEEKYKAMLESNPAIASMRRLFPEIDL